MRRHLSYANVAATLALLFSMTGSALAAKHYLINSTKQINPKVLRALRGNKGVTGPAGLQGKEGPAGKGAEGPAGKLGVTGKEGPTGATGAAGMARVVTRYGPQIPLEMGEGGASYAACLEGEVVTGGGYDFPESTPPAAGFRLDDARPSIKRVQLGHTFYTPPENGGAASGWLVDMENLTGSTFKFQAYVQCASP